MTATATKPETERTCKLTSNEYGHPILTLAETKGVRVRKTTRTHYHLECNPTRGVRAFRLFKMPEQGEEQEVYDVQLIPEPSCDCKGFTAHGHCKHYDALLALAAWNRLPSVCTLCYGTGQAIGGGLWDDLEQCPNCNGTGERP